MPTVPTQFSASSSGLTTQGTQPSPTDLLMAASEMHSMGKLGDSSKPNPLKPHNPHKKLKVIK